MQSLGEKMSEADLNEMIAEADDDEDGLINYEGWLWAAIVAQPYSTYLVIERSWVQFPPGAELFSSSILGYMSLNKSPK